MPEWKTKALGKAPTFGFNDARPIKEQRESLPIFKLRDQLIEAVNTNQARTAPLQLLLNNHHSVPHAWGAMVPVRTEGCLCAHVSTQHNSVYAEVHCHCNLGPKILRVKINVM